MDNFMSKDIALTDMQMIYTNNVYKLLIRHMEFSDPYSLGTRLTTDIRRAQNNTIFEMKYGHTNCTTR